MYRGYVQRLAKVFAAEFSRIEALFGFDHGDEFEIAICRVLRAALPSRFGIARGFVVDRNDNVAGDDVIIFERARFPSLGLREDFHRIEQIPIEAVYCYIEAKHTIELYGGDGQSLDKAIEQVAAVKRLCSTRKAVGFGQVDPHLDLNVGPLQFSGPKGYPAIRNPVFAAIFARYVRERKGDPRLTAPHDIHQALRRRSDQRCDHPPDLVVYGDSNIALPCVGTPPAYDSPFFLPKVSNYALVVREQTAFGVALCALMHALDWIRLGEMDWRAILAHELTPRTTDV
jgi:hypothetical protein